MAEFTQDQVHVDQLLLDPNNYRFHDDPKFAVANRARCHEDTVQSRAFQRLQDDGLEDLKRSFQENGFLPIELVIVTAYDCVEDHERYLVIEGNRRVAALKWLQQDLNAAIDISEAARRAIEAVRILVVEQEDLDTAFIPALLGIRHVSGIKEWGGYQRSELVVDLRDNHGLDSQHVGDRLAMATREVNRRYRAFKALQQVQQDEDYGELSDPDMYPLFHEAVSVPVVRDEWLKWNDEAARFENEEELTKFYELITGYEDPQRDDHSDPKITTYQHVRQLRDILPNRDARRVLFNPSRSFADAVAEVQRAQQRTQWATILEEAIESLDQIPATELAELEDDKLELLNKLHEKVGELLRAYQRLVKED